MIRESFSMTGHNSVMPINGVLFSCLYTIEK